MIAKLMKTATVLKLALAATAMSATAVFGWLAGTMAVTAPLSAAETSYRLVENWAQLPSGYAWGTMSAVAIDARGNVYGFQRGDPTSKVIVFDAQGRYLKTWGEGTFPYAHGMRAIAIDSSGRVWVGDRGNKRLQVFDQEGRYLNQMTQFGTPASIFIKGDLLYVAAPAPENRVTIGTTDGNVLETIEGLNAPHGIAVDSNGAIYVAQSGGKAILKFAKK